MSDMTWLDGMRWIGLGWFGLGEISSAVQCSVAQCQSYHVMSCQAGAWADRQYDQWKV